MERLVIAKFGGSAIGPFGESIPVIIQRISELKKNSKIIAVFSAPLTIVDDQKKSLTDIILEIGKQVQNQQEIDLGIVRHTYNKILEKTFSVNTSTNQDSIQQQLLLQECKNTIDSFLKLTHDALLTAQRTGKFADEVRSKALGFSGEILMSHIMYYILKLHGISNCSVIDFKKQWPIITDHNIEYTNFLARESLQRLAYTENLVKQHQIVCMGGFIGITTDGTVTTYERGGTDRTAADMGILFHKKYQCRIDFEKDSAVVSADPKIVTENLTDVTKLSYNEARLAGMFGMKILDPIAIKEILENGVDIPIIITNMKNPQKVTVIERSPNEDDETHHHHHPLKIITGKKNCAIIRMEQDCAQKLLQSLEHQKRYSEYIVLSPFTKDGTEFARILFLDGDYVKRNDKYILAFDPLASITYNRGVITLIGDQMWRVQQIASKVSSKIGDAGLNILNMDAQEETSRIIIVIEDSNDNIPKAIESIHSEKPNISFI